LGPKRQRWDIADAFESIGAATAIATTLEQTVSARVASEQSVALAQWQQEDRPRRVLLRAVGS